MELFYILNLGLGAHTIMQYSQVILQSDYYHIMWFNAFDDFEDLDAKGSTILIHQPD